MFASVVIGILVFIIAIIVYVEYKNEKTYQEERKRRSEERRKSKPPYKPEKKIQKPVTEETVPAVKVEEKTYELPTCEYPKFDYSRLLKMGLSEDEALEFIKELIPQIKTQLPLIREAMDKGNFHDMERLTHSLKGSSTTVGTGGVSDLLVEFNTYLKTGKDVPVAEAYFKHLNRYSDELEKQFA